MGRTLGAGLGLTVSDQDIYEISASQKYRVGTRLVRGDRVFRYVKAGATLNPDFLSWSYNAQQITFAAAPVAALTGATTFSMTVGSSDGPGADGELAAHYLDGGHVVIFSDSVDTFVMQIKDNTAVASGGGTTVLTVDGEIPVGILVADSFIEANASPYIDIRTGNSGGYRPFWGAPMRALTTSYPYGWIQTWGPTWIAPQGAVGVAANNNAIVVRHDGSIDEIDVSDANVDMAQRVGFVMCRVTANTQGAPFIFLQIAP